jgi:hypothetical protein
MLLETQHQFGRMNYYSHQQTVMCANKEIIVVVVVVVVTYCNWAVTWWH